MRNHPRVDQFLSIISMVKRVAFELATAILFIWLLFRLLIKELH